MPPSKQNTPEQGDALELHEDGTVRVAWDGNDITLRRPKFGEWISFLEESEAADTWLRAETRTTVDLVKDDSPYRKLYARILTELGTPAPDPTSPATWMVDGGVLIRLSRHWRSDPLTRSQAAQGMAIL